MNSVQDPTEGQHVRGAWHQLRCSIKSFLLSISFCISLFQNSQSLTVQPRTVFRAGTAHSLPPLPQQPKLRPWHQALDFPSMRLRGGGFCEAEDFVDISNRFRDAIVKNEVVLLVRGALEQPTCSSCDEVVKLLQNEAVDFCSYDISSDPAVDAALKAKLENERGVSLVGDVPLLFVKGRLLGGLDIVRQLVEDGELKREIQNFQNMESLLIARNGAETAWKQALSSGAGELVEDDDLLQNQPLFASTQKGEPCDDAGKKTKKACKNCSCGLAEAQAAGSNPDEQTPKSACGSCYLGDAFRCESCPYKGMPPFKPGEKVSLMPVDDI